MSGQQLLVEASAAASMHKYTFTEPFQHNLKVRKVTVNEQFSRVQLLTGWMLS